MADTCPGFCSGCPMRSLGFPVMAVTETHGGAIGAVRLRSGQVLDTRVLADRFLMVRSGGLKVEFLDADGVPGIAAFLLAGDPVVTAFSEGPTAITALKDTRLCEFDPARVHCSPDVAGDVIRTLTHAVGAQAAEDQHRLIRARSGPVVQRLHWFLKDLALRQRCVTVTLPMNRTDLAHYLAMTTESVSRAFSELDREGAIVRERPRRIRMIG